MHTISSRIKELREKKNLTQQALANLLNISHQSISKWERNESTPDVESIIFLSKIFQVSTDYILLGNHKNQWYFDVKIDKVRPILPIEKLSESEQYAIYTSLLPDMSEDVKVLLHKHGYLDYHYSYMWSEGREMMEEYYYDCSQIIIEAFQNAKNLNEVYEEVKASIQISEPLFKIFVDQLVSQGKLKHISNLINQK